MRGLVTGITGFGGRAMASHLAARGWTVIGSHGGQRPLPVGMQWPGTQVVTHDLTDFGHTTNLLRNTRPDFIFHLSGQTGTAFETLLSSHVNATSNLLEAARVACPDAVIVIPGSSAQFGDVPQDHQPIKEDI